MFQGFLTRSDTYRDVKLEIEKIGRLEISGGGGGGGGGGFGSRGIVCIENGPHHQGSGVCLCFRTRY